MESQMAGGDLESTSPTAPSAGPAPRKKRSDTLGNPQDPLFLILQVFCVFGCVCVCVCMFCRCIIFVFTAYRVMISLFFLFLLSDF